MASLKNKLFAGKTFLWMRKNRKPLCIAVTCLLAALLVFAFPIKQEDAPDFVFDEYTNVSKICELSTLRCYYHNVAEFEKQPEGLFQYGLAARYGYKKLWMGYSGTVEIGINADEVVVSAPDQNGVVRVYVPDAVILNISADKDSLTPPLTETGWLTYITREEEALVFSEAQKNMRLQAESDTRLLARAKNNAKKLIEQYIINIGNELGQTYSVQWLDAPAKQ